MNCNTNRRFVVFCMTVIFGLFFNVNGQQDAFAHKTDVHGYCGEEHEDEEPNLTKRSIVISGIQFQELDETRMKEGAVDEDAYKWYEWMPRYRDHHYNPHTGQAGPFGGDTALETVLSRWDLMRDAFEEPDRRWLGDRFFGRQGSLHAVGRVLHLLQDMAAPPHTHAPEGHGWLFQDDIWTWSSYYSDFEETWGWSSDQHQEWSFPPTTRMPR